MKPSKSVTDIHHRRSTRLRGYDYTQNGAYFITICAHKHQCVFGEIIDGEMHLNELGCVVEECLKNITMHFQNTEVNTFVVMPNHTHIVITLTDGCRGTACRAPTERFSQPTSDSIPTIIRSFKSAATKRINELRLTPGQPIWQRNYYEHVIRDEDDLNSIREYIEHNALKWAEDKENPLRPR